METKIPRKYIEAADLLINSGAVGDCVQRSIDDNLGTGGKPYMQEAIKLAKEIEKTFSTEACFDAAIMLYAEYLWQRKPQE